MRRTDLLHVIRAACDVLDADEVIVVGSQAILASWPDEELPDAATRSAEADVAATHDPDGDASFRLSGVLGEDSPFNRTHGYFVDGVDPTTATLPDDWRDRAVRVSTYSVARGHDVHGICPEAADLCVSKLAALRTKDQEFVAALLQAGMVSADEVLDRIEATTDFDPLGRDRAIAWVEGMRHRKSQSADVAPPDSRA